MKKPILNEKFADNGEHSHWELIDANTGEVLWGKIDAVLPQADVIKSLPINKCNCERCTGIKVDGYYKDETE